MKLNVGNRRQMNKYSNKHNKTKTPFTNIRNKIDIYTHTFKYILTYAYHRTELFLPKKKNEKLLHGQF